MFVNRNEINGTEFVLVLLLQARTLLLFYPLSISMNGGGKFFFNILALWAINIAQAKNNARVA